MSTQINPYQPPTISPVVVSGALESGQSIVFQGSMTRHEGQQADELMRGKKLASKTDSKILFQGFLLALLLLAWVGWEAVVHDELDQLLLPAAQIFALAVVFVGVWRFQKSRDQQHADLKACKKGVFMQVGGSVNANGFDYLSDDFPMQYAWQDFVGCRISEDVILLYIDFPREMNFVAASYFANTLQWQRQNGWFSSTSRRLSRWR